MNITSEDAAAQVSFGSWAEYTNRVDPAASVAEFLGANAHAFDAQGLTEAYIEAVRDNLPSWVSLAGDGFLIRVAEYREALEVGAVEAHRGLVRDAIDTVDLGRLAERYALYDD